MFESELKNENKMTDAHSKNSAFAREGHPCLCSHALAQEKNTQKTLVAEGLSRKKEQKVHQSGFF